jgi:hypothetical protein
MTFRPRQGSAFLAPPVPGFSGEIIRIHPGRVLSFGLDEAPPGR